MPGDRHGARSFAAGHHTIVVPVHGGEQSLGPGDVVSGWPELKLSGIYYEENGMKALSAYGAGWIIIFDKSPVQGFQKLADRHAAWFAEHPGWDALPSLVDELAEYLVDDR